MGEANSSLNPVGGSDAERHPHEAECVKLSEGYGRQESEHDLHQSGQRNTRAVGSLLRGPRNTQHSTDGFGDSEDVPGNIQPLVRNVSDEVLESRKGIPGIHRASSGAEVSAHHKEHRAVQSRLVDTGSDRACLDKPNDSDRSSIGLRGFIGRREELRAPKPISGRRKERFEDRLSQANRQKKGAPCSVAQRHEVRSGAVSSDDRQAGLSSIARVRASMGLEVASESGQEGRAEVRGAHPEEIVRQGAHAERRDAAEDLKAPGALELSCDGTVPRREHGRHDGGDGSPRVAENPYSPETASSVEKQSVYSLSSDRWIQLPLYDNPLDRYELPSVGLALKDILECAGVKFYER